ncbi:hypothetical protein SB6425_03529 [Klebsiella huaxiensis]|uniref:Transposase IS111A/IS1328/IS1533 N-terminal domain-containing protein n=1 Tax=Klebsiella huaxiensis TaxID=2153354 RepID=A0ABT6EFN8_9ENTR|nr:hypothetical protein [Klebsiella huaxiensis]MDG1643065.1 hypothetical protein [Klebsiella huaxiensis]VUS67488.1 hypothetical protein SB6425_03529 [Klebsiella huaxiensis]
MSEMKIAGIDLAKANFYFFSIDAYGKPAGEIKLSRNNLLKTYSTYSTYSTGLFSNTR